jgi:hypothetical protein
MTAELVRVAPLPLGHRKDDILSAGDHVASLPRAANDLPGL